MVDFLTRLAERTLGVASMVQPIIAPVFATEPRLAKEAPSFQREGGSVVQSMIAPGPASGVQHFQPDDMSLDTDNMAPARERFSPADVRLSLPPALVPVNGYLSPGQGLPGTRYEQAESFHGENTPDGYSSVAAPRNVPAMNTPVISDRGVITPNLNVDIAQGRKSPGLPAREGSPAPQTEFPDYDMLAKARQAMIGVPSAGTLDTLPTIRVTIGRIEVRAVMSTNEPAVRPASTRPKLKLSLDDYLKRQNGG